MQGIGPSMNMLADFAGISGVNSGIKDLTGNGVSNPFQALLQTVAQNQFNVSNVHNDSSEELPLLTKEQLSSLKEILQNMQEFLEGSGSESEELMDIFKEMEPLLEELEKTDLDVTEATEDQIFVQPEHLDLLISMMGGLLGANGLVSEEFNELRIQLESVLKELNELSNTGEKQNLDEALYIPVISSTETITKHANTENNLVVDSNKLWHEVNQQITKALEGQDPAKLAPKVLKLLEQWNALGKQLEKLAGNSEIDMNQSVDKSVKFPAPAEGIWKSLTETFQKRTAMVDKNVYNTVSKVSAADVSKWIANAVEVNSQQVNAAGSSMPMAKLEQFVIHMNPVQTNQQQNENFTTQFARIVDTSKFMQSGVNGKPLTITLNPGNLGEIMVKMQRVNGELMVKLFVESPEAKRLLESNLGQLRHMFSPHQVAVERQEQQVQTTQNAQQNQQSFKENNDKEQQQGKQQQSEQLRDEISDEMSFSEFLMNAKV